MQFNKEKAKKIMDRSAVLFARLFLTLYAAAVIVFGAADYFLPDSISVFVSENGVSDSVSDKSVTQSATAKLFGVVPVKNVDVDVIPEIKLIPCGNVFGVKFFTKGVIVINLSQIETKKGLVSPAKEAGLAVGDIITSVDGMEVNTVEALAECVENSKGSPMRVKYTRDGQELECSLTASLSLSDKKYKSGIWVRDSTAGIGTMTFYNPDNGTFAGLGHGICDVDTGEIMPLLRANVVDVEISDIIKGRRGTPGEIKGNFDSVKRGTLTGNTKYGVYGIMDERPDGITKETIEVAFSDKIREGKAVIYTELDGKGVKPYEVEISSIDKKSENGKNFVIEITDGALLEKTGGIVQGMSGSPVIQDGKLVGAVTHVLVNDPTKGYGLFIENMLSEMPELMK